MSKPRLLALTQSLTLSRAHPYFYQGMVEPNYGAFSQQFDLIIQSDFNDVGAVIRDTAPDLVMLDPGPGVQRSVLPDVAAVKESCQCPIVFYSTLDAHYHSQHEIIAYLDRLQPDAIFSHDFYHDYYPQHLRSRLVVIPNSYNDDVFFNMNLERDIVCGFYGAGFFDSDSYPWRRRVAARVAPEFPSYILPRPTGLRDHGVVGEHFSRILNRTRFVFGCTSPKDIPVKKLFEVPACGALLMTNRSSVSEAMGFEDGVNCAFVDPDNVLQTIRFYLDNPQQWHKVARAGQHLVQQQHTAHNRKHILNWYHAFTNKNSRQRVVQRDLMGGVVATSKPEASAKQWCPPVTAVCRLLYQARELWRQQSNERALPYYHELTSIYPLLTEAAIGYSYCLVCAGQYHKAGQFIDKYLNVLGTRSSVVLNVQLAIYALLIFLKLENSQQINRILSMLSNNNDFSALSQSDVTFDNMFLLAEKNSESFCFTNTEVAEGSFYEHFLAFQDD